MSTEYSEDRLVQQTTAAFFAVELGWESVYAYDSEVLGPEGTLGRRDQSEVVLLRYLRPKLEDLNPGHPADAYAQAVEQLTATGASKRLFRANRAMDALIRDGIRVEYKTADGSLRTPRLRVLDFDEPENNHFLVVRELWVEGPLYRRRPDIVGFVNGLPLLFVELKAQHKNVRVAYDDNLSDYLDTIPHLFHHNAVCMLSNGDEARVGTVFSPFDYFHQWKRIEEDREETGRVPWEVMLRALGSKESFLDLVESFVLFDDSPSGGAIKALAANHQLMGVNRAFAAVRERKARRGKLGVFWHTQGSGKSYSMVFLSRKVHRKLRGSFTFVILTDRVELDEQIARTFAGCGAVREAKAVHARDGAHLAQLLREDHRYVFTLVHKFNRDDEEPYTDREDVIVIADEAHRTQYGKLAENMRRVLPKASFLAFTGTPLMRTPTDQLTREIFGDYVSKYDFKRAVEDGATVPLYYDNRGEKLELATFDLNDRIAEELEKHELDQDQEERLRRDLSRDYHVLTANERLERIARDVTAHFSRRWETGKAMLVALDKITCVRMFDLVSHYWAEQIGRQKDRVSALEADRDQLERRFAEGDGQTRKRVLAAHREREDDARRKLEWLRSTEICVVVSEEQNEVRRFRDWGLDIQPHRRKMKQRELDEEFKKAEHPFRLAIVCAMWLTGFDVPSLATLYLDKPMTGHTLMQAIARANRKAEGKNNGHLVDYNGMLKSLRAALAKYGPGRGIEGAGGGEVPPAEGLDQLLGAFVRAVEACEAHLEACGFELQRLIEAEGFGKIALLSKSVEDSAVNAVCAADETRARFEVLAREVFKKRRALVAEPELTKPYRRRADALDAIAKKLEENREAADVTAVMKGLREVVSAAITHHPMTRLPGTESGKVFDISHIDFDRLRREFEALENPNTTLQSLKDAIEKKLRLLVEQNPLRTDFSERYRKIIDTYNRETDRVTIEKTFEELVRFVDELSEEEQRAAREGLEEEHLAVFDLLVRTKGDLGRQERDRVKQVAVGLLEALEAELAKLDHWREKRQTQAQVRQLIHDRLYDESTGLPVGLYTDEEVEQLAQVVYLHVYRHTERDVAPAAANGGSPLSVSGFSIQSEPSAPSSRTDLSLVPDRDDGARELPFRVLPDGEIEPYVNAVPLVDLEVAAGEFSPEQVVDEGLGDHTWVALESRFEPSRDLFVARVVGESMNRRIPNGAYCLWKRSPGGTRNERVMLVSHRNVLDPETESRFTVKIYSSEKVFDAEGNWLHFRVTLRPHSTDPGFGPIVFDGEEAGELRIVAEMLEVLG